jgi:hypothetical protein
MAPTIGRYKSSGATLISAAEDHIDVESVQNEISAIGKLPIPSSDPFSLEGIVLEQSWSEHVEYIFDTLDYIQLHQEEFSEFHQLATQLLESIDEYQTQLQSVTDAELNSFDDQIEKLSEQVELLTQKGEFLLQSSASAGGDDNQVESLLDDVNRNYDLFILKIKTRLESVETSLEQVRRQSSRRSNIQATV